MDLSIETIAIIAVLAGQLVTLVIAVRKPNEKQDVKIASMNVEMGELKRSMELMRTNHLPHIEAEVKNNSERLVCIETILDERLPRKDQTYGS